MAYVDTEPYFDNTTTKAYYNMQNVLRAYRITPDEGYVIHAKTLDTDIYDEESREPTGKIIKGYTRATVSVGYNYNFEGNPLEIYAVLESEVPPDRIFGGGTAGRCEQ